ncbi:MAG TPA: hypothetical protein VF334_08935 [Polyangia bacterium]
MKADDELIELAASAFRPRDPRDGRARPHPAWLDLDESGRQEAFDEAARARRLEAALDRDGLSTTARAVLAQIRAGAR